MEQFPFLGTQVRLVSLPGILLSENLYQPEASLAPHTHDRAFFSLTLAGGYFERHGDRSIEYGLQSISFHPKGEQHSVSIGFHPVRCFNVELDAFWMERLACLTGKTPQFMMQQGAELSWMGGRMYEETFSDGMASALAVEGLILQMLAVVADLQFEERDAAEPRWLKRIDEVIHAEFTSGITVSELAGRVGLHPVHVSRTWQRFRRCSIHETVARLRVETACARIAQGVSSFAELSLELGFFDQAHFSRVFKRVMGMTPRAFRARQL